MYRRGGQFGRDKEIKDTTGVSNKVFCVDSVGLVVPKKLLLKLIFSILPSYSFWVIYDRCSLFVIYVLCFYNFHLPTFSMCTFHTFLTRPTLIFSIKSIGYGKKHWYFNPNIIIMDWVSDTPLILLICKIYESSLGIKIFLPIHKNNNRYYVNIYNVLLYTFLDILVFSITLIKVDHQMASLSFLSIFYVF